MSETTVSAIAAPTAPSSGSVWQPERLRPLAMAAIAMAVLTAIAAVFYAWQLPPFGLDSQFTDNATVEGRVTVIAPQVSGYVSAVAVHDYQKVHKGDVLVTIDDGIYRAHVAQAQASLDAQLVALANNKQAHAAREADLAAQQATVEGAQAQLFKAQADMTRADGLVKDVTIARSQYDQTQAALRAAQAQVRDTQANVQVAQEAIRSVDVGQGGLEAQVEEARAALRLAEIDLAHATITASEDGQVGEIGVHLGQFVTPGTQLFSIVPSDLWIIANYKEAQTSRIAVGQSAAVWVDALGGARLLGHVEHIAPAAGSEFAVLKPDNATGNFVKVPQRIGVLIRIDPGQKFAERLVPGMSVETRVETGQ